MLFEVPDQKFIAVNQDSLVKRLSIFSFTILAWALTEHFVRPLCGSFFQSLRDYFGNGAFVQNVFSESLAVDGLCFLLFLIFVRMKLIPIPRFRAAPVKILREGLFWGPVICIPTIPLALYLGYNLGFTINWQNILGNIISNSYEEFTYRVFLFSVTAYAFRNIFVGILVSAVLFASIHTQYPLSMQLLVGLGALGFSLAYLRSGSIVAALIAHQISDMILDTILF